MSEALKKCPFCGGEAELVEETVTKGCWGHHEYKVVCSEGCVETCAYMTPKEAVAYWNERAEVKE